MGILSQQLLKPTQGVNILLFACDFIFYIFTKDIFSFSMFLVSAKLLNVITSSFTGIKSRMNHKPIKTACLFADYIQFILRRKPGLLFLFNSINSQNPSAALWNLGTINWMIFQYDRQEMLACTSISSSPRRDCWTWLYKKKLFSP